MMSDLGVEGERTALTPFVVENDWWITQAAEVDREVIRKSWDVAPGQMVILFCAKLQAWKRPADLVRAFAGLQPAERSGADLAGEATALGIRDRGRFLGFVNQSQLPGVHTAADLIMLPSEYEPFAVAVVNEAFW
jgi:hypothetical protein